MNRVRALRADATFCALAGVDVTDHRAAAAQLPPIDSISMVPVLLGTPGARPRLSLPIGAEPRLSNLSTAPPCASLTQPKVYDGSLEAGQGLPEARQGNCSSVVGLIVDEGEDGLWKLITGDENQVRTSKQLLTEPFRAKDQTEVGNWFLRTVRLGRPALPKQLDEL